MRNEDPYMYIEKVEEGTKEEEITGKFCRKLEWKLESNLHSLGKKHMQAAVMIRVLCR